MDEILTQIDGLTILNTTGGGTASEMISGAAAFALIFGAVALVAAVVWAAEDNSNGFGWVPLIAATVCVALVIFGRHDAPVPVKYEVTVQPGHVIDAARWEVVEQRGQIYVIAEREGAAE